MIAAIVIASCIAYFVLVGVTLEFIPEDWNEVGRVLLACIWPVILPVIAGQRLVYLPEAIANMLAERRARKALPAARMVRR